MSLKCVYCGKDASYVYKGTSLCKEHLSKECNPDESIQKSEVITINAPAVPE